MIDRLRRRLRDWLLGDPRSEHGVIWEAVVTLEADRDHLRRELAAALHRIDTIEREAGELVNVLTNGCVSRLTRHVQEWHHVNQEATR